MYAGPQHDRDQIDGLAAFSAAAFLTGMGLVAALAHVGAPDRLVEALGPLIALVGLAVIGAMTRTARLTDFLAARRAIPALYGGLAFAAVAAGLILALGAAPGERLPLPAGSIALGLAIAALVVGPLLRAANASAVSDVLATRFALARWPLALVLWITGVLVAIAGLETAIDIVVGNLGQSRRATEIIVAILLAATIVPGGLKGLLWSDAASAGGALAIAAIGAGLASLGGGTGDGAALAIGWLAAPQAPADSATLLFDVAATLSVGLFVVFIPPAIGALPGQARRAGIFGLFFSLAGLALGASGLAAFWPDGAAAARSPTASALVSAATWLPALALARAGVLSASRAAGIDLVTAYSRLAVLASARIARTRLMMLAVIVLATAAADFRLIGASKAIWLALALNLAFVAPCLILAAASRWRWPSALAALATSLATLARLGAYAALAAGPREILIDALIASATALIAGAVVGVVSGAQRRVARADPFSDLPFEASE